MTLKFNLQWIYDHNTVHWYLNEQYIIIVYVFSPYLLKTEIKYVHYCVEHKMSLGNYHLFDKHAIKK